MGLEVTWGPRLPCSLAWVGVGGLLSLLQVPRWDTYCQLLALEALETLFPWQQLGGSLLHGQLFLGLCTSSFPSLIVEAWPLAWGWATRVAGCLSIPHPSASL